MTPRPESFLDVVIDFCGAVILAASLLLLTCILAGALSGFIGRYWP